MTDAYQCDECRDFYAGEPGETVYARTIDRFQNTEFVVRAELCPKCSDKFAGGSE